MSATDVPARWWAGSAAAPRTADTAADMRRYVEDAVRAGLVAVPDD
jgi:hypothetical protein